MSWVIERGGIDFLMVGAQSFGRERFSGRGAIAMAARALMLYIDPDNAKMFTNMRNPN